MNKFIVSGLMGFFFLFTQVAVASQQEAQELCMQQFLSQCMDRCQKTNDINCTQACQENAQNQCRQAGE